MGQGRGKCTSDAKLQARSNKTASSPKGNAGLEISPDDFWAPLQLPGVFMIPGKSSLGTQEPSADSFLAGGEAKAELSEVSWSKPGLGEGLTLRWEITEWEGQRGKCECGLGTLEERQWGIPSWAAGFIRIVEQAWRCALISSVLFVFVAAARGCRGPSNLYHVLIVLGNRQGSAGGWVGENGLPWWIMVTSSQFQHARNSSSFTQKGKRNVLMLKWN